MGTRSRLFLVLCCGLVALGQAEGQDPRPEPIPRPTVILEGVCPPVMPADVARPLIVLGDGFPGASFTVDGEDVEALAVGQKLAVVAAPPLCSGAHILSVNKERATANFPLLASPDPRDVAASLRSLDRSAQLGSESELMDARVARKVRSDLGVIQRHLIDARPAREKAGLAKLSGLERFISARTPQEIDDQLSEGLLFGLDLLRQDVKECTIKVFGPPMVCAGDSATYKGVISPEGTITYTVAKGEDFATTAQDGNDLTVTTKEGKSGTMQIRADGAAKTGAKCSYTFEIDVGVEEIELNICIFLVKHPKGGVTYAPLVDPDFRDLEKDDPFRKKLLTGINAIVQQACVRYKIRAIVELQLGDSFFASDGSLIGTTDGDLKEIKKKASEALAAQGIEDDVCIPIVIAAAIVRGEAPASGATGAGISVVTELQPPEVDAGKKKEKDEEPLGRLPRTTAHESSHILGLLDLVLGRPPKFLEDSVNNDLLSLLMTPGSAGRPDATALTTDEGRRMRKKAEKIAKGQEKSKKK